MSEPTSHSAIQMDKVQMEKLRVSLNSFYDIQNLRISIGNRLSASFLGLGNVSKNRTKEAVKAKKNGESTKEIDEEEEKRAILDELANEYNLISMQIAKYLENKKTNNPSERTISNIIHEMDESTIDLIKDIYDYKMVKEFMSLVDTENNIKKNIENQVKTHPMWKAFFENVKGCGPLMSAVCLCYFDIDKARHPSSFWKYAGLDVVITPEGECKGRNNKFTVEQTYIDSDGNEKTKRGLGYNPKLKSKLIFVLSGSLLKAGRGEGYSKAYYNYKNRLDNRADTKDFTKIHKHNMAIRYMVKQFIRDMWIVWREMAGYDIGEPFYEVEKLGRKHHNYNEALEKYNT